MIPAESLATLQAVVDEGSLDAAARALHVTPSAVSQRLKALEQRLGRVLLIRSKPARATPAGEVLLRLARQQQLLEREALAELGLDEARGVELAVAINSDSLATWIMPALHRVAEREGVLLEVVRDDQNDTAARLAAGTVMAAVTSEEVAVPGCRSVLLGRMVYRASATPEFAARWFPDGVTAAALAAAPVIDFDRRDDLQTRFLRSITRQRIDPPRHRIPGAADFADAVRLGLGWAMLLDHQLAAHPDELVELAPHKPLEVPLYWQQWDLRSASLDALADEVRTAAAAALA
ncbi:LysR family transcriptional regulator ArgP [Schumannella luteola]|uniref:HTH-type transcriptional regulator LysG n=1 Tax=Schumannella luteola TaxID=472059 RepID=A0A852Y839_9MICO|nr:LysR family transcriptional regulator ArgP [Schumannella luteola]NYG98553.1 LysR family transcriptional regulator (chromosome initiation inhibitor) [Schumannella luteola]TPX01226.1 LysR family transcriptional regulator ArgP [Schumannella luteola]